VGRPKVELAASDLEIGRGCAEWVIGTLAGLDRAARDGDLIEHERLLLAVSREMSELRGILSIRVP
jgi:hypothetical protein